MSERVLGRLYDIADALEQIDIMLDGKSLSDLAADRAGAAAFERFLEIVSEASRYIPAAMQDMTLSVDWVRLRGLGNILRHAYHRVDPEILWSFYADGELASLKQAVLMLIEKTEPSHESE